MNEFFLFLVSCLKSVLFSSNSIMLKASSTSGIPALKSVIPLKRSCKGGVNFNEATAIVAKKGTISNSFKLVTLIYFVKAKPQKLPIAK